MKATAAAKFIRENFTGKTIKTAKRNGDEYVTLVFTDGSTIDFETLNIGWDLEKEEGK